MNKKYKTLRVVLVSESGKYVANVDLQVPKREFESSYTDEENEKWYEEWYIGGFNFSGRIFKKTNDWYYYVSLNMWCRVYEEVKFRL